MYAPERLTAEACVQHEAFALLIQKQQQQQKRLQRQKQEQQQQQQRPYLQMAEKEFFPLVFSLLGRPLWARSINRKHSMSTTMKWYISLFLSSIVV